MDPWCAETSFATATCNATALHPRVHDRSVCVTRARPQKRGQSQLPQDLHGHHKKRYWSWKGEHLLPMYTTTAWHVTALNSPTCSRSSTQVPTRNCQWGSVCLTLKQKDKERDCKAKSHMSHICFPAIIVQGCSGNAHPTDRSPIFASFARWPLRLSGLGMTWNAFSQTLLST